MVAWAGAVSFAVSFLVIKALIARFGSFALDQPNARSLHHRPVPRTGGMGVMAGAILGGVLSGSAVLALLAGAGMLAILSFLDDIRGLPPGIRFGGHALAAVATVWFFLAPMHPGLFVVLAISVVWITNLYNFMDGSDGLAGGMAVFGFSTYAIAAHPAGDMALFSLSVAVASAALAFLVFNFHPARIFLGDVGSIPLGFLAATIGLVGWRDDAWPLWFPLLAFGPFIGDATITLLKRLVRRERVWQAHRDHYYQRMVRMGFGHRRTAAIVYALMLVSSAAALIGRTQTPAWQAAAFCTATVAMAAVAVWVDVRWSNTGDIR